jgi:hypothetical protein
LAKQLNRALRGDDDVPVDFIMSLDLDGSSDMSRAITLEKQSSLFLNTTVLIKIERVDHIGRVKACLHDNYVSAIMNFDDEDPWVLTAAVIAFRSSVNSAHFNSLIRDTVRGEWHQLDDISLSNRVISVESAQELIERQSELLVYVRQSVAGSGGMCLPVSADERKSLSDAIARFCRPIHQDGIPLHSFAMGGAGHSYYRDIEYTHFTS